MFDIQQLKLIIKIHDVISFDIFDTLILRTYLFPEDLWKHIEQVYVCNDFYLIRSKNNTGKYSSLHEIYQTIPTQYKLFEKIEELLEIDNSLLNTPIIEAYNYAIKLGKKVILASDMYLSKNTITQMLNKNGIFNWDKFYLSNDDKCRKDDGTMFIKILHEYPNLKILHIGDNLLSDIAIPLRFGIATFQILHIDLVFFQKQPFIAEFLKQYNTIESRTLIKLLAYMLLTSNITSYWYELGIIVGSVISIGYMQKILKTCKENNIEHILFASRDGYIFKQIFDKLKYGIKSTYIYVPTYVMYSDDTNLKHEYLLYIDSLHITEKNIAIVDTITGRCTSQKLIQNALHCDVYLFAYTALNNIVNGEFFMKNMWYFNHFIEFMLSAPHPTVKYIKDLLPVYKDNLTPNEKFILSIYPDISSAIIKSVEFMLKIFERMNLTVTNTITEQYLNTFMTKMTNSDKINLELLRHESLLQNENCDKIIFT